MVDEIQLCLVRRYGFWCRRIDSGYILLVYFLAFDIALRLFIISAGDWTPAYYTALYYTCIIPYEMFYTDGRSDCMYWTPYRTQNLWNKFNIISDPIQCIAIKTAVAFFEKLPQSAVLAVINLYQSPNNRIRNNHTIGTKTCENGTY